MIVMNFLVIVLTVKLNMAVPFQDSTSACKFISQQTDEAILFKVEPSVSGYSFVEHTCKDPVFIDPPKPDGYFEYESEEKKEDEDK